MQVESLADLRKRRLYLCRLTQDRKLDTLDEAEAFLIDRGVLTLTQDSALPSLFAATPEAVGAVVSRDVAVDDGKGGHRHTSELARWDQVWNKPWKANQDQALAELVLIGVRAAVLAHQDEVGKWFSWPIEWPLLAELISARRLQRPGPGWLAIPE